MFTKCICAVGVASASIFSPAIARPHRILQDAYEVAVDEITLFDVDTNIPDIVAVHNGKLCVLRSSARTGSYGLRITHISSQSTTGIQFEVFAKLAWASEIFVEGSSNILSYEMSIDGNIEGTGSVDLNESRDLPTSISCGYGTMNTSGKHVVEVKVTVDDFESGNEREYQSFAAGASFVPLIVVLVIAATTHMVRKIRVTF